MADPRDPSATSTANPLPLPTGRTPRREEFLFSPAEVAATADFGPPPTDWLLAPPYAWRVGVRQRALQADAKRLNAELEQAEEERDEGLAEIVVGLRPKLEAEPRWSRLLTAVHAAEVLIRGRSERLAKTNLAYGAELGKIERRRTEVEQSVAERRTVNQEHARVLAEQDHELKRTEGRLKRVQIEIRNISQLAEQAAVGGAGTGSPAVYAQQLSQLEKQASDLTRAVNELRAQLQSTKFDSGLVRSELDDLEKEQKRVDKQRKDLDNRYASELNSGIVTSGDVQRLERQALADAGRGLLATPDTDLLDAQAIAGVRTSDEKVHRCARALELRTAALDAFDQDIAARGRTLLAAALVGVLLLVGAIVLLS